MDPAMIERMIEAGRDSYEARLAAGQAWLKGGEAERAVEHLRKAIAFKPEQTAAWQALGQALQAGGDLTGCRQAWSRGIEMASANGDVQAEKVMRVWLKRLDRDRA
jgi:Tfp pilus assembly protein PilF